MARSVPKLAGRGTDLLAGRVMSPDVLRQQPMLGSLERSANRAEPGKSRRSVVLLRLPRAARAVAAVPRGLVEKQRDH